MRSAHFSPSSTLLPDVYRRDEASFAQVDAFMGLTDALHRAYAARLQDLASWLSPEAVRRWPGDVDPSEGRDRLLARYIEVYDELAGWWAMEYPALWSSDEDGGLDRRRRFLRQAARMWRRRSTPVGFLDWFCTWFRIDRTEERPVLLEHYKYGRIQPPEGEVSPPTAHRATLLVRATPDFATYSSRIAAREFANKYAPAHLWLRVCFLDPGQAVPELAMQAGPADFEAHREAIRNLLCTVADHISHGAALHLGDCIDDAETLRDVLDAGVLPTHPEPTQP